MRKIGLLVLSLFLFGFIFGCGSSNQIRKDGVDIKFYAESPNGKVEEVSIPSTIHPDAFKEEIMASYKDDFINNGGSLNAIGKNCSGCCCLRIIGWCAIIGCTCCSEPTPN